jgi:hypothetical protein
MLKIIIQVVKVRDNAGIFDNCGDLSKNFSPSLLHFGPENKRISPESTDFGTTNYLTFERYDIFTEKLMTKNCQI